MINQVHSTRYVQYHLFSSPSLRFCSLVVVSPLTPSAYPLPVHFRLAFALLNHNTNLHLSTILSLYHLTIRPVLLTPPYKLQLLPYFKLDSLLTRIQSTHPSRVRRVSHNTLYSPFTISSCTTTPFTHLVHILYLTFTPLSLPPSPYQLCPPPPSHPSRDHILSPIPVPPLTSSIHPTLSPFILLHPSSSAVCTTSCLLILHPGLPSRSLARSLSCILHSYTYPL